MTPLKKIAIACDHAGLSLKKQVCDWLKELKVSYDDLGCHSEDSVDYPDYAAAVARQVSRGDVAQGILICGTGMGMAMTANKFNGVRAVTAFDEYTARMSREHNDANVLCLGGRTIKPEIAKGLLKIFLETPFTEGRHVRRLEKISQIEKKK